uniref:L1 transposable element RRM domain-containing protein n=1 Tax=Amphiprion ocellaris TaxID=80972 RepID=A0AAQ6A293_AMPOC
MRNSEFSLKSYMVAPLSFPPIPALPLNSGLAFLKDLQYMAGTEGDMTLQSVLNAIQQVKTDMLSHLDAKIDPIQSSLTAIQISLSTLSDRVELLEQRVSTNEDNVSNIMSRMKQLESDNTNLKAKVEDLENRSRRNNLRFVGIPEFAESTDMVGFMTQLIYKVLGQENFPSPLKIERAHRTPTTLPKRLDPGGKPRSILIKLLDFQDKKTILRIAREKGQLIFHGSAISIYPDFSAEVMNKQRLFDPVKRNLRGRMKYFMKFPATLCVIVDGKLQQFTCHKRAEAIFMSEPNSPAGMSY